MGGDGREHTREGDSWLLLCAFLMHFGPEFKLSTADLEQVALAYP